MRVDDSETPVAVVDLDRLEANIARFQAYPDRHVVANCPHIKIHKIREIARMQIDAGAVKIACEKLDGAEVVGGQASRTS